MIHMLSAFDLKPHEDAQAFRAAHAEFVAELRAAALIVSAGPVGRRVADTPMDTDTGRSQQYFALMSFRDRAQMDAAYAHIAAQRPPVATPHAVVFRRIDNGVFLCWEDPA